MKLISNRAHRHVAVKIFTNDGRETDEIAVYKHISQGNKARLGYRYVRTALDSFELLNRDGKHPCLVHEPLWDSITTLLERSGRDRLPEELLRVILQRLLLALDYLHTDRKVIHTGLSPLGFRAGISADFICIDIKADNILHLIEDTSILTAFEAAELSHPSPRKRIADREIYLSRPLSMPSSIGEPVLCDFSNAVDGTKINDTDVYPDIYRCPEVMLHLPWSYSADIWNVGAMVSLHPRPPKQGRETLLY